VQAENVSAFMPFLRKLAKPKAQFETAEIPRINLNIKIIAFENYIILQKFIMQSVFIFIFWRNYLDNKCIWAKYFSWL
jgi:hypothetical protein